MRFGLEAPFVPVGYPEDLYIRPAAQKVKKVKKTLKLSLSPDLKQVINSLAKQLPEHFWYDPHIFNKSPDVLLRLSQTEPMESPVRRWFSGVFNVVQEEKRIALYRVVNNIAHQLVAGDSGDLLEYITKYCITALPNFVETHRRGLVKYQRTEQRFCDRLKSYRATRALSKGLDRCSKIDELDYIDQDSTFFKFPVIEYWMGNKVCWHLGSGMEFSTSQRALYMYDQVVLVDPLLRAEGPLHWKKTWQEVLPNIPAGVDVVSDVAYGDEWGLVATGMWDLVESLYKISDTRLVMVKISLDASYPGVRGLVVSKPRPHNSELVVVLDVDGDLLDELILGYQQAADVVNITRNERIFKHQFPDVLKPVRVTSHDLGMLIRKRPPELPRIPRLLRETVCRVNLYCETAGLKHLGKRAEVWGNVCRERKIGDGPYCLLPTCFDLYPGPVQEFDPGLCCPYVSIRSVFETAILQKMRPHYLKDRWVLCNGNV